MSRAPSPSKASGRDPPPPSRTSRGSSMFQRLSSILFGDDAEGGGGGRRHDDPAFDEKEDDGEWILVDYLAAEACAGPRLDGSAGVCPQAKVGSPPDCPARYSSCSSLDSAADEAEEAEPEDAEDEGDGEGDEGGFLRLDACALEESWFITPPPCFMAGGRAPVLLETSPLEDLLIEHPSMSVYAVHTPCRALREAACRALDQPLRRAEAAPRRPGSHAACYATALSPRAAYPKQAKAGRPAQRSPAPRDGPERQHLSRNALRRLNLLRDGSARQAKSGGASLVHQPGQRQFNY